jgi:hypothetical protein
MLWNFKDVISNVSHHRVLNKRDVSAASGFVLIREVARRGERYCIKYVIKLHSYCYKCLILVVFGIDEHLHVYIYIETYVLHRFSKCQICQVTLPASLEILHVSRLCEL